MRAVLAGFAPGHSRIQPYVKKIVAVALLVAAVACAQEAPPPAQPARSASVRIVVSDTTAAVDAIAKEAEGRGGYVAETRVWRDGDVQRATITLRVPAKHLTSTLASIHRIAQRVEDERLGAAPLDHAL